MPEVYNWQLGRKMLYPYEERHPKWQFAFVFNINRCIACQTCSMADKSTWLFSKGQEYMWWNNVETKPYGGYPQFYDVKVAQLVEQVNPGGQVWNTRVGRKHHAPYGVFEGVTIFDAGAQIGQAAIGYIPADQEGPVGDIHAGTGGEPMETRCMAACVGKIRLQGLNRIGEDGLWAEDRWHPLYYTIRVEQVALPLYPQWGTEPNGFYIPPRWAPRGYIRQMFGPGVDNAIDRYIVPSRELLAVLQLWRASQQIIFRYDVIPGAEGVGH